VKKFSKSQLLLTTLLSTAVIGSAAMPAFAQESGDQVIVTGSRISKQDFNSNSPVATISAVQFERTGAINTEELLNALPQTVPGLTRTSNNPGNGTATIDLRGLGSNRTLILVNGRRAMPNGSGGVVDINTIAPSMIQNVEVLTGGASSVYGADAISGVVNFILKDDFEGMEANMGYQISEKGDAQILNANLTMGANIDSGRGNVMVNMSYTDRSAVFQGDRDFANVAQFDDGNGGLEPGGSSGVPGTSIFAGGLGTFSPDSFGILFNPDGSIRPFQTSGQVNDFYNYAPVNFLQLPQERFTIATSANYQINEHAEAYMEARFANNTVPQELAPTPAFVGTSFTLDGNPFIDAAAQQVLSDAIGTGVDTDGDGIDDEASALLRRRLVEVGPRQGTDRRNTFQLLGGLRGAITSNWDYDLSFSAGRTQNASNQGGNIDVPRFNQSLLLNTDAGGQVILDANGNPTCADTSSNGSTSSCVPLNIFGAGNISPEAADFIRTRVATTDETTQNVLQLNFTGDLGDMSFTDEPIGVALGGEYIENKFEFNPDQGVASSSIRGFNGAPPVAGEYDVYSAYGEMSVPLVSGMAFAENITLDLAGRVSNFSTVGTKYNYKIGGTWAVNEQVRFRGNYNTAVRAPNIGELFAPVGENFPGATDPCSASGAVGGTVTAAVAAICAATGVPTNVIGTAAIDPAAGQVRSLSGGNPLLDVETSETITFGVVLNPSFIEGLQVSVDYFDIGIDNFITLFGGGTGNILATCYDNTDPLGGVGSQFCNAVNRRADGTIDFVSNQSANVGSNSLKGIDVSANYAFDMEDAIGMDLGNVNLSYLGTYTMENQFEGFAGDQLIDCAGFFGNRCGEPDPSYRHYITANLSKGPLTTQVTWQLIGSVNDGFALRSPALAQPSVFRLPTGNYFNTSATYDFTDSFAMTFGIRNVFDRKPPVIGNNDEQANTFPSTYDVFGRSFFANAKVRF
jgi:iron complex outermembrane recepter protein